LNRLIIESSSTQASVALFSGNELLVEEVFPSGRGPVSPLFTIVARLLTMVDTLDDLVVGVGPGSYSGIRIGISAVIGLQLARNLQGRGIHSALGYEGGDYQVILDARGSWIFSSVRGGEIAVEPTNVTREELDAKIDSGLPVHSPNVVPGWVETPTFPRAAVLGQRLLSGTVTADLPLLPLYLKPPHITAAKPIVPKS
jgi:tRNA threonylcarbamoyladenosine biosynthesis protein TsaB